MLMQIYQKKKFIMIIWIRVTVMGTGANVESSAQCKSVTEVWFGRGIFEIMDKTSEKFTTLTCLEQISHPINVCPEL